jgi:cobaltochelatase CobS
MNTNAPNANMIQQIGSIFNLSALPEGVSQTLVERTLPRAAYAFEAGSQIKTDPAFHERRKIIGQAAQVYSVLIEDQLGFEVARDSLLAIIRAGLTLENVSAAWLSNFAATTDPEHHKLFGNLDRSKLSTRYLLKMQNYTTLVAIAATRYDVETTKWLMAGYGWSACESSAGRGRPNWGNSWSREIGLTVSPFRHRLAYMVAHMASHGLTIAELCAFWPEGPFANGFSKDAATKHKTTDTTDTTTTEELNMTATTNANVPVVNDTMKPMINAVLSSAGLKLTIDEMLDGMIKAQKAVPLLAEATSAAEKMEQEIGALKAQLSRAAATPMSMSIPTQQGSTIPSGKSSMVKAEKVFPELAGLDFPVPQFTWDAPHPDVPAANPEYQFRRTILVKVLRALSTGANSWLSGHTGTGKTTLIEQIAARLGWPVARIAFDSSLDRAEMVGRMQLKGDGKGGTISEWLPGILERAISNNYILLCDEIDVARPDALYTLQPILEGKGLELLEDGGRRVHRAPLCRIVATGNTTGNGDPSGLYQACRILPAATLDRFNSWVIVPYMTEEEEIKLIKSSVPGLKVALVKKLAKFATEMRSSFINNNMPISYSPRRSMAFAHAIADFSAMGMEEGKAKSVAFCQSIFDSAPVEFKQRIAELAQLTLSDIDTSVEA